MSSRSRLPDLGQLSIALLEALVTPVIGDRAVGVIKAPSQESQLRNKLQDILLQVERKFIAKHDNQALSAALINLPFHNLDSLQIAIRAFYDNPASSNLADLLSQRIRIDFKYFDSKEIDDAVQQYLAILRREIIPLSEEIRQKLQVDSILNIQEDLQDLVKAFKTLRAEKQSTLGLSPAMPPLVVGRDHDLRVLKEKLAGSQTTDSHVQVLTAIRGWPGVGKTTIAAVLAHDNEIARYFPDGVLWISLGPKPNLLTAATLWGRSLGEDFLKYGHLAEASSRLSQLLRNRSMLLVIDDVWEPEHAVPFIVGGTKCATLITTRENSVALDLAPTAEDIYRLPVLTEHYSIVLLQKLAPGIVSRFPAECRQLAIELEGLPLALQVAGHMLNAEEEYGFSASDLLNELRNATRILQAKAPADRTDVENATTPSVAALLLKSTDRLDPYTRECFACLGVFAPKPATFDLSVMKKMWQTDDPAPIIRVLVDRGLLDPIADAGRFQLHSLLVAHARSLLTKN